MQEINVGLIGFGTVGSGLAQVIADGSDNDPAEAVIGQFRQFRGNSGDSVLQ